MNSIEFGKKCRPYNVQYRDVFGYVPCRNDYNCGQDEYFQALLKAIETKCELSAIVPKKNKEFQEPIRDTKTWRRARLVVPALPVCRKLNECNAKRGG